MSQQYRKQELKKKFPILIIFFYLIWNNIEQFDFFIWRCNISIRKCFFTKHWHKSTATVTSTMISHECGYVVLKKSTMLVCVCFEVKTAISTVFTFLNIVSSVFSQHSKYIRNVVIASVAHAFVVNFTSCTHFTVNDNWVLFLFAQSRSICKAHFVGWKHFFLISTCTFPSNIEGSPLYSISWSGHRLRFTATLQPFSFCCIKFMVPGKNEICSTLKYLTGLVGIMFDYFTTMLHVDNEVVSRQSMEIFSGLFCTCTH